MTEPDTIAKLMREQNIDAKTAKARIDLFGVEYHILRGEEMNSEQMAEALTRARELNAMGYSGALPEDDCREAVLRAQRGRKLIGLAMQRIWERKLWRGELVEED